MFNSKIYNVGIYIRLSKEDEDKKKLESESITNQRNLILNYINKAEDNFKIYDEYIELHLKDQTLIGLLKILKVVKLIVLLQKIIQD